MKVVLLALTILVAAGASPLAAQTDSSPRPTGARVLAGPSGVSVAAEAVPLDEILREVSRVTGVAVFFEASLAPAITRRPTSVSVRDVPLEDALKRILRDVNFIVSYGPERPDAVRIFGSGGGARQGPFTRLPVRQPEPTASRRERLLTGTPNPQLADPNRTETADDDDDTEDVAALESAALGHADPVRRAQALQRLSEVGDEARARTVALNALERDQDPTVLREALNLLESQDALPRETLMRFASGSRPAELRLQALDILADSGTNDAAFRRLVASLVRDQSPEVRARAQELLEDLEVDSGSR